MQLVAYHKINKKLYLIREIAFGIGEVMRKFDPRVPSGDNIISEVTLWDREDSKLRNHKFAYYPTNKFSRCSDIKKLIIYYCLHDSCQGECLNEITGFCPSLKKIV